MRFKAAPLVIVLLLAALAVSSCDISPGINPGYDASLVQRAVAQSDHLIVPGQRVGPFRLGMLLDEVLQRFGTPQRILSPYIGEPNSRRYRYSDVIVSFDGSSAPTVTNVEVDGGDYRTDRGIGIGSTTFDVVRAYGQPSRQDWFWYDGVRFRPIIGTYQIVSIDVSRVFTR